MNALTRRAGPLPRWAWLALALAAVAGYILFVKPRSATAAAPGSSDASSQLPVTSGSATDQGSVNGSPSDAATADLLAALGNDNQQLLSSLAAQSQLFYQGFGSYVPGSSTSSAGEGGITALIGQTGLYPASNVGPISPYQTQSSGLPAGTQVIDPGFYTATPTPTPATSTSTHPIAAPGRAVAT